MTTQGKLLILLVCAGFIGCFLLGSTPASALNFQGITVTPSVSYTGEYDDNIFRTPVNKRGDYINTISPGIALQAVPGNHVLKAYYRADILRYSNNSSQDTVRHFANLGTYFNFNRLQLRLKEDFAHTDDFPSSELTQRIKRNENSLTGGFDYDVADRWGVGFDFTWGITDYLDPNFDFLSENAYTYATNIYYRISEKTRVFAEYDFVQEVFFNDKTRSDYRHRGLLGVRGELTERLTLTAKGGYEHLNYYNTDTRSSQNNFVMALDGSYRPLERLQFNLLVTVSTQASSFADNADYTEYMAILGASYNFTPKIAVVPKGFFGADTYKESTLNTGNGMVEKRLDYIFGGGLAVRYQIQKWLRLEVAYEFQRRDSNFSEFSYSDNRAFFTVTFSM